MNRMSATPVGGCLGLLAAGMLSVGWDWPRWEGPRGDGHIPPGMPVPAAIPAGLQPVWRAPLGSGLASPVVGAGRVLQLDMDGEQEVVRAYDANEGRLLWTVTLDVVFRDHLPVGPRAAALVDGDRVYVQSCRGEFRCLALADGRTLWRVNFVRDFGAQFHGEVGDATGAARHGYTGAPWVSGDRLYVAAGGQPGHGVICLDKFTGKKIWASTDEPAAYAGPVLATVNGRPQLLVFTATALMGLRPDDGRCIWRCPVTTAFGRHITVPRMAGDLVLASSHQFGLFAVRPPSEGDAVSLSPVWVARTNAVNVAPLIVVGRHVYSLGPSRRLQCVEVESGRRCWSQENFSGAPLRQDWTGLIGMGDRILLLAGNGRLLIMAANPEKFQVLSGPEQVCGPTWSLPAWDGRRLYLRDDAALMAFELPTMDTSQKSVP